MTDKEGSTPTKDTTKAIKRSWKKAGVKTGHLTGRYGYDVSTGLPVADLSSQPIQSAKDRFAEAKERQGDKK